MHLKPTAATQGGEVSLEENCFPDLPVSPPTALRLASCLGLSQPRQHPPGLCSLQKTPYPPRTSYNMGWTGEAESPWAGRGRKITGRVQACVIYQEIR